jgi:hypothetical protein
MLSGTNTYTGATGIDAGTLNHSNGRMSFGSGGTAFTVGGLAGTVDLALTNAGGVAGALTVGGNSSGTAYADKRTGILPTPVERALCPGIP